jgi:predicted transcriptional regulator
LIQEKNLFKLSGIGKIVAKKMKPLLDTIYVLEENADYWSYRDMREIPNFLLRRINELGHCTIIEPYTDYIFEMIPEYVENAGKATRLQAAIPYFHPLFPSFYLKVAERGTSVSLVLPEQILKRWIEDYREQTEKFLEMGNTNLFVCSNCERIPSATSADNFTAIALFPKNEIFDRKYIIGFEPGAIAWGKELYGYYEQLSKRIHSINNWGYETDLNIKGDPEAYQI